MIIFAEWKVEVFGLACPVRIFADALRCEIIRLLADESMWLKHWPSSDSDFVVNHNCTSKGKAPRGHEFDGTIQLRGMEITTRAALDDVTAKIKEAVRAMRDCLIDRESVGAEWESHITLAWAPGVTHDE